MSLIHSAKGCTWCWNKYTAMKIARTVDFFEDQYQKAVSHLESYFHDPAVETLHQFRVEVKKIRAVCFQLEQLKDRRKVKKYHHQIRHIFRKGGHIRELQLERAWLSRHRKFNLIRLMAYDANLEKADKSFHMEVPEMLHIFKKARKKLDQYLQLVTQDESDHYVTEQWCVTLQSVLAVTADSAWHETRKKIKQLLYARNWIPSDAVQTAPVKKIFQGLDKLQDLIGQWHDLLVLENKILGIHKKVKGHAILIRELQLAIGKLNIEKENLAVRIRRTLQKIRKQISAYH